MIPRVPCSAAHYVLLYVFSLPAGKPAMGPHRVYPGNTTLPYGVIGGWSNVFLLALSELGHGESKPGQALDIRKEGCGRGQ